MILKRLSILNYRNIEEARLDFSDNLNCFVGSNGVGKTNLLDAVYYLSFCRSAFNPIDSQVIKHDRDFFVLEGEYSADNASDSKDGEAELEHIYCGMKRGTKKHFKRNKKEYKRLSQHIGFIPLVFVSPSDSYLIDGGSEERRRLMDMVIAQYDIAYIEALSNYNKALQQRNVLLKQEQEPDPLLLDIWENEMATNGEQVYRKRKQFVEELIPVFQELYSEISSDSERVALEYVSHCDRGPLLDVIQRDRMKDRAVGYSLHGIHRDDLLMTIGGYQMKREGSQGQNKSFVLALKLAQFDFLRRTVANTTPILLLDDIFDKLDATRVEQIVRLVASNRFGQIFITDTNREHLDRILTSINSDYRIFKVEAGVVKRWEGVESV